MNTNVDRWKVSLQIKTGSKEIIVQGISRWAAIMAAAHKWHIPWTMIVGGCTIEKLEAKEEATNVPLQKRNLRKL